MKLFYFKLTLFAFLGLLFIKPSGTKEFKGKAYYFSKSKMELGSWGARMSEAQKKQIQYRLKNRLEKTYVLKFNKEESIFDEEVQLDVVSGATDSWGSNFKRGQQYKNLSGNTLVQSQEFYGKKFLVKDKLQIIDWELGKESKKIGQYLCFKATASVPTSELTWFDFSWSDLSRQDQSESTDSGDSKENSVPLTEVEAWYTLQIPVGHGPGEYWGLPGLILEVSAGNTTMLCSKVVLNPKEEILITPPNKGKEITKNDYQKTIMTKMVEMRNNRGRRRN